MLFLSNDTALLNETSTSETVLNSLPEAYMKMAVSSQEYFLWKFKTVVIY